MKTYSPEQFAKLKKLRNQLLQSCEICKGRGYVLTNGDDEPCRCIVVFKYVKRLINAHIAPAYWHLELAELEIGAAYKKLMTTYLEHFEIAKQKALGLLLEGPNGVGKTACLAEIGKYAIVNGYEVVYITAEKYVTELARYGDSSQLLKEVEAADVILLDELDKAYIREDSSFVPKKVEDLVRRSISNGKIISIATNMDNAALVETFGDSFVSMLKRQLKIVPLVGDDRSVSMQRDWTRELQTAFDYYSPAIVKAAYERMEHCDVDY